MSAKKTEAITVEVCVDNIESLITAIKAGADRIELCSALALGGLTPSYGFVKIALKYAAHSSTPIYAMIRPRAGDFIFNADEIEMMIEEISQMKTLGVQGVVVGALTELGEIDTEALDQLVHIAHSGTHPIGVTFHRAFDLSADPQKSLERLISAGCERILTSGLEATAELGIETIHTLVKLAENRISIMPGAGVHADNASMIIDSTKAREIHLSGKTSRKSRMKLNSSVKMGSDQTSDTLIDVTSFEKVNAVVNTLNR